MTHCVAFWTVFERDGDVCGLDKRTKQSCSRYLDLVQELSQYGVNREDCYRLFPASCIMNTGFLGLRRDSKIRVETINKIVSNIINGKKTKGKDVHAWVGIRKLSPEEVKENFNNYVSGPIAAGLARTKKSVEQAKERTPNEQCLPIACATTNRNFDLTEKKRSILRVLNTGQYNILLSMIQGGYAEDEYAAFCIALKWAAERLEAEKAAKEGVS